MDDIFVGTVCVAPFTLIGWIIFFFLFRQNKRGRKVFLFSFAIYLLIAVSFFIWMLNETGLGGLIPLFFGCGALIIYSILLFAVMGIMKNQIVHSQNNSQ